MTSKMAPGIGPSIMVPHPPLIVPQVGRGQEREIAPTTAAFERAARFVVDAQPDTVIVLSPHTTLYQDYFHISPGAGASGDLARFGARSVRFSVEYDQELAQAVAHAADGDSFPAGTQGERAPALDHGTMVPLYFLHQAAGGTLPFRLLRVGLSGLSFVMHYQLGQRLAQAAQALGRRVSVVASGDLSHYLQHAGPYGFRSEGPVYDARVMDVMGRAAFDELLQFDEHACETAGECGQRSFLILAGCLDGRDVSAQALSYQDVTGVGYGVCLFTPGEPNPARRFLDNKEA